MSFNSRSVPAFGKRTSDEVWARAQQESRELPMCAFRFSASLAALVSTAFLLLLDAVRLLGGSAEGLGLAGAYAAWLGGGANMLAGLLVLIPAALLAQYACALLSLGLSGQPLVVVDTGGIAVLSRSGEVGMAWEELRRISFGPAAARIEREPAAMPSARGGTGNRRVRVATALMSGGASALRQAIAEIRPDMGRRLFD